MSRAAGRLILNGRLGRQMVDQLQYVKMQCDAMTPTTGKGENNIASSKDKRQEITEEKELGITIR